MMAVWSEVNISQAKDTNRIDSEFFQPIFIKNERILKSKNTQPLDYYLSDVRYGLNIPPTYTKVGLKFYRALNLKEYGIDGDVLSIPYSVNDIGKINILKEGDILIVRSGANVGDTGIIYKYMEGGAFGSYTIRIRVRGIDPYYLYAFLKSQFGRLQTIRLRSGSAQPNISIPNLRCLLVFKPKKPYLENNIRDQILKSHKKCKESEALYERAENLFMEELGLANLHLSPTLYYTRKFSETEESERIDAEFFQPSYQKIVDICMGYKGGFKRLSDLLESVTNGVECRTFVSEGTPYIRVGDMGRLRISYDSAEKITKEDAEKLIKKIRLKEADVLTARSGSIGQAAVVTKKDLLSVLSSHLIRLRLRKDSPITNTYLALFLATTPGIQQILKNGNGGIVPEISQPNLKRIVVPIPPKNFQNELTNIINNAREEEDKSHCLLDIAKTMVEEAMFS